MTDFVDTNVLIYAFDAHDEQRSGIARTVLAELWKSGRGALSTQVLQEFYAVATKKLRPPLPAADARRVVADYAEWVAVETTPQLIVSASLLAEQHTVAFWDALIIEAALLSGARRLISDDLQDGRRFASLEVHNPFPGRSAV